jgi:hypothetical protein
MQLPDRAAVALWLRRPRNRVLVGVLALLVAVRIALPYVLRPIIVDQADKALVGRIALADLDLSLIRGGVTLHGLEVYPEELPPPGTPVDPKAEPKKPLFSAGRLWTQISWLELLRKTIDVEEFELEDFAVRVDRLKDGLVLPKPVPSSEPAPPPAEPEAEGSGWAFAADSLALTRGNIAFRDFTVGEAPQRFDLAIDSIAARKLALRFDPSGSEPGHVELEAELGGGGTIGFEADVETKQAGPAVHSKITLSQLPIGGVRVYLKMFGWSDLEGTLDAVIEHNFETAGAHDVSGTLSLSAVSAKVPELDRPAIQFDKLSVTLDKIDLVKQHAAVADVALTNLRLEVDPRLPRLMPLLNPPAKSAAPEPAPQVEPAPVSTLPTTFGEFEVVLRGDLEVLIQGIVEIPQIRPNDRIAPGVPVGAHRLQAIAACIEPFIDCVSAGVEIASGHNIGTTGASTRTAAIKYPVRRRGRTARDLCDPSGARLAEKTNLVERIRRFTRHLVGA